MELTRGIGKGTPEKGTEMATTQVGQIEYQAMTRSPNYPAIDIGRAIERVRTLHRLERQHPVPALQAVKNWGYTTLNSPGGGQLAALARFGLLHDEGTKDDRMVKVTDLAVTILEHPDATVREDAVRQAAMLPAVHQDMWQRYGCELPSEENLKWFLTRERGFSENGAKDFIKEYRATIEFAKPRADVAEEPSVDDVEPEPRVAGTPSAAARFPEQTPAAPVPATQTVGSMPPIAFPLASGKLVAVSGLGDLSEAEWAQFLAVLAALKPSIVRSHPSEAAPESEPG